MTFRTFLNLSELFRTASVLAPEPIECSTPAKALEDVRHHNFRPPSAASCCFLEQLDQLPFLTSLGTHLPTAFAKPVLCLQYSPMGDHIDKACTCQHIPGRAKVSNLDIHQQRHIFRIDELVMPEDVEDFIDNSSSFNALMSLIGIALFTVLSTPV